MPLRTVVLALSGKNTESCVIIDGMDISSMCRGVEVIAFIGQPTLITLHLIANCQLSADVLTVEVKREGEST